MGTDGLYNTPLESFIEFVKLIGVALAIALVIRTFFIEPYYIPSGSMLKTLQEGDRVFITKFSYGVHLPFIKKEIVNLGDVQRGDVVVFPYPENPDITYIKRVVGIGGDVIEVRNKQLYRNGSPVQESYIQHTQLGISPGVRDNYGPVVVPEGKLFVMGDNRDESQDSRYWHFVDKDTVYGKARIIFWSCNNWINIAWDRIGKIIH